MTRAEVTARGFSADGAEPRWGAFAASPDPLAAAARELAAGRSARLCRLDRPTLAALVATHLALEAAGREAHRRTAVLVVAVEDGSRAADRAYWTTARVRGGAEASPTLFAGSLPSAVAGEISMTFGLRCPCLVVAGLGAAGDGIAAASLLAAPSGVPPGDAMRLDVRLSGWGGDGDGDVLAACEPLSCAGIRTRNLGH